MDRLKEAVAILHEVSMRLSSGNSLSHKDWWIADRIRNFLADNEPDLDNYSHEKSLPDAAVSGDGEILQIERSVFDRLVA